MYMGMGKKKIERWRGLRLEGSRRIVYGKWYLRTAILVR